MQEKKRLSGQSFSETQALTLPASETAPPELHWQPSAEEASAQNAAPSKCSGFMAAPEQGDPVAVKTLRPPGF